MCLKFAYKIKEAYLLQLIKKETILKLIGDNPHIVRNNIEGDWMWKYKIEEASGEYSIVSDEFGIFYENGESTFLNLKEGIILKREKRCYLINSMLISAYIDVSEQGLIEVFKENLNLKFPVKKSRDIITGDYLLRLPYDEDNIECCVLNFKNKCWSHSINAISGCTTIYADRLQIIDNKLFFFAHDSNWENYGTFCLDANTGEVLKRIEMAGFIYKHNDYIYVTNGKSITQINPDTFEIERIDLSGELKELDLIIDGERSFFFKDKLYFAAKPGDNTTRSVLGVLDLNSYKLLETYELLRDPSQPSCNENRYQIQNIKANDYQVAVNTAGDTLHVFEIKD